MPHSPLFVLAEVDDALNDVLFALFLADGLTDLSDLTHDAQSDLSVVVLEELRDDRDEVVYHVLGPHD
jgi:hypothetical protein